MQEWEEFQPPPHHFLDPKQSWDIECMHRSPTGQMAHLEPFKVRKRERVKPPCEAELGDVTSCNPKSGEDDRKLEIELSLKLSSTGVMTLSPVLIVKI